MNKITSISNLNRTFVEDLFLKTKLIKKSKIIQLGGFEGKTICLLFFEKSTRTKFSFELAAKRLGFNVLDFSEEISSMGKGESLEDTLNTFVAMGVNGFVVRHPEDKISLKIAKLLPDNVFFINAGDGNHAHPTQALLDVFTIQENFQKIDQLEVAILGDSKHSRVIPSFIELLKLFNCNNLKFFGPPELLNQEHAPAVNGIKADAFSKTDVLFVLRIQKERFQGFENINMKTFIEEFQINTSVLKASNFSGLLMHPGPLNINHEITEEVAASSSSLVLNQVSNGVFLRTALLQLIA